MSLIEKLAEYEQLKTEVLMWRGTVTAEELAKLQPWPSRLQYAPDSAGETQWRIDSLRWELIAARALLAAAEKQTKVVQNRLNWFIADTVEGMECPPECDNFAHEEECPVANPVAAFRVLREQLAAAEKRAEEAEHVAGYMHHDAELAHGRLAKANAGDRAKGCNNRHRDQLFNRFGWSGAARTAACCCLRTSEAVLSAQQEMILRVSVAHADECSGFKTLPRVKEARSKYGTVTRCKHCGLALWTSDELRKAAAPKRKVKK